MSFRYSNLINIAVSQSNSSNILTGPIVYNSDGNLFYALGGNTGSAPVIANLSYIKANNGTATCSPIGNPPSELTLSNSSNNLYTMVYCNKRLYVCCSYVSLQYTLICNFNTDYTSVTTYIKTNNYNSRDLNLCQIYLNPYNNNLYSLAYKSVTLGGPFYFDPSYAIYNLNTDPSLNNPIIPTKTFDTDLSSSTVNTVLACCAFDSSNNVYYVNLDGIYKTSIDSAFNFNISSKSKIIPFNTTGQSPWLNYNSYINSLYYNYYNGTTWGVYIYDLNTSTITNNVNQNNTWGITIDTLCNMYFLQSNSTGPSFNMKVNYRIVCFKENTQILTQSGYKRIQDLKKGELVKTSQNGYTPIYKIGCTEINHQCSEERIKDQLYKCSTQNFPEVFEDLVITGCHCILVDRFKDEKQLEEANKVNNLLCKDVPYMTEDKYRLPACVDERTTVYEVAGEYTIYHFALENDNYYMNYGVYANGLLVESTSKRFMDNLKMTELKNPEE